MLKQKSGHQTCSVENPLVQSLKTLNLKKEKKKSKNSKMRSLDPAGLLSILRDAA